MKVICVLRTGGIYDHRHVHTLFRGVCSNFEDPDFTCLTDSPNVWPVIAEPLKHGWPGWWSKMEMFKIPGPAIYLDLDTIIVGGIEWLGDIARKHRFCMLRDPYRGKDHKGARGSGVMTWSGDMSHLYDDYVKDPVFGNGGGDQHWIELRETADALQDHAPGRLASYKADLRANPPGDAVSIVYFHGRPRPWEQEVVPYELA